MNLKNIGFSTVVGAARTTAEKIGIENNGVRLNLENVFGPSNTFINGNNFNKTTNIYQHGVLMDIQNYPFVMLLKSYHEVLWQTSDLQSYRK